MWATTWQLSTRRPPSQQNFHITLVRDDQGLVDWVRVSEEGFGQELGYFYDAYARHGYGPGAYSRTILATWVIPPVTSGTLLDARGTASIFDISTIQPTAGWGSVGQITYAL